jgi:hypothetical protein
MVFSKLQQRSFGRRSRALLSTVVNEQVVRSRVKKQSKKSKAASIKLTLAAVGLDADNLLRSCTSSFVHNKERHNAYRADLLEVRATRLKRRADNINR